MKKITVSSKTLSNVGKKIYSRGQGMTEYLVIVGLIGVSAIGVFSFFGQTIQTQVSGMAAEISGTGGTAQITAAQTAAKAAATQAAVKKNMGTYDAGNKP